MCVQTFSSLQSCYSRDLSCFYHSLGILLTTSRTASYKVQDIFHFPSEPKPVGVTATWRISTITYQHHLRSSPNWFHWIYYQKRALEIAPCLIKVAQCMFLSLLLFIIPAAHARFSHVRNAQQKPMKCIVLRTPLVAQRSLIISFKKKS